MANASEIGEGFFLHAPMPNQHMFGRDDLAPGLPDINQEPIIHSAVEAAEKTYTSYYKKLNSETAILVATRHFGSKRYQDNRAKAGMACCVAALAQLRSLRARAWNEDTVDVALDVGNRLFEESLEERGGELRRLILAELNDTIKINDVTYDLKVRGVAVWGRMMSGDPLVFDLRRGLIAFFKDSDTGILQIPGEYEVAIWHEGGKFYMFDPYPATKHGRKIGLREGGKSYVMQFPHLSHMCEHFANNLNGGQRRKPFSVSELTVHKKCGVQEPLGNFRAVAPSRWVVSGRFHEGDARFPEEHRNKQATAAAIAAIAIAHVREPAEWCQQDVDNAVVTGDALYGQSVAAMGDAAKDAPAARAGAGAGDDADADAGGEERAPPPADVARGLAAGDVLTKFRVSEYDCIETEVQDCAINGRLNAHQGSGLMNLRNALHHLFQEHTHAVVTARGGSIAVWKHDHHLYYFDPHGCDENGYRTESVRAAACLVRLDGHSTELALVILSNLAAGSDDTFNISPVDVTATRLNEETGVPEISLQSDAFEWVKPGTAALLLGARGQSSAAGKVAARAGVEEDMSGRTLALPAAAAFAAAAAAVPPPQMHQDHMHQFLEAGADYYLEHVKTTGRTEMEVQDLQQKFELGANTFAVDVGEPITLPLKLPDAPVKLDEEVDEEEEKELGEGEVEEEEEENKIREIKDAMAATMWKPNSLALLIGDYHILGVWCSRGGQVVAFDPAPTLRGGLLTAHRFEKGDELRLKRIADAVVHGEDDQESDAGGEEIEEEEEVAGEEKMVEAVENVVPADAAPALHVYASPNEFITRLVAQGGMSTAQRLAPYKLYPVTVSNELTSTAKEKRTNAAPPQTKGDGDNANEEAPAEAAEAAPAQLGSEAVGKHFSRMSRSHAVVRGRIAQYEHYYLEPNRDNQDAAMSVMGIVVDHIEPCKYWQTSLIDALLKYGDRLYTVSLPSAHHRPHIHAHDVIRHFHVLNFDVSLDVTQEVVGGDIKAGDQGEPLDIKRAINIFFEQHTHGVLCAKEYCVGIWRAADGKAICMWEPHGVSASGRSSPTGAAALCVYADVSQLADVYLHNIGYLGRPGHNKFSIASVKVTWEFAKPSEPPRPEGTKLDEGYDHKVLTAYVEIAKGRTILRGSRPKDMLKFWHDTVTESSCGAVVGACMTAARRPELWTKSTVNEIMKTSAKLFQTSVSALGYELRPGEEYLLPLQVAQGFTLGVNYVKFRLEMMFAGMLELFDPCQMNFQLALGLFLSRGTRCVVWSAPHAVAIWRSAGSALYYLWEPHACAATGLRSYTQDVAPCVLTFTSHKTLALAYLQNIPHEERAYREFQLFSIEPTVEEIELPPGSSPPLVKPTATGLVPLPATSKVDIHGRKRRADESVRKHRAESMTCLDVPQLPTFDLPQHPKLLSVEYSMGPSMGNQALACSVMAVAMARVQDICRWGNSTLRQVTDSGDQLYRDSYLHFRPQKTRALTLEQILRKLYTPGNCVCRLVVYQARQGGDAAVEAALRGQLSEFFREECAGVVVGAEYAAALFRNARGYYLFEPVERDRYGRVVECRGRTRAALSRFERKEELAAYVDATFPRATVAAVEDTPSGPREVPKSTETPFTVHGILVTDLRRLNRNER